MRSAHGVCIWPWVGHCQTVTQALARGTTSTHGVRVHTSSNYLLDPGWPRSFGRLERGEIRLKKEWTVLQHELCVGRLVLRRQDRTLRVRTCAKSKLTLHGHRLNRVDQQNRSPFAPWAVARSHYTLLVQSAAPSFQLYNNSATVVNFS